jgi:hypothetical protein
MSDLINVRFGPLCGLKSDISQLPFLAKGDIPAICSFALNGELVVSRKWPIRG